jgi:hypothetical protein
MEMGLKRIYFISRDGEILLEIARRLLPVFWPEAAIDLRYLLGSRQAWLLPSFAVSTQGMDFYALNLLQNSTLQDIFKRVALTYEDCEAALIRHGFETNDWNRKFTPLAKARIKALIRDPAIQSCIERRAKDFMTNAVGYLAQEGLFDAVPYAMADLGWSGMSKAALERILSARGKRPPPFFLFGRIEGKGQDDLSVSHAYHFDVDHGMGKERHLQGMPVLMETFCVSTAEGLLHYENKNGRFKPVLRKSNADALQEWGFEVMRNSILQFAERLGAAAPRLKAPAYLPVRAVDALLRSFWIYPTKEESLVWGGFPFEEDASGLSHHRLVQPLRPINFWRLLVFGRAFKEYSEWKGGLSAAHSIWVRMLLVVCAGGHAVIRFFYRWIFGRKN